jgi:magnesium transporter
MNVVRQADRGSGKTRAAPAGGQVKDSGMKALILEGDVVVQTSDFDTISAAHAAGKNFWVELDERNAETEKLLNEVLKIHPLAIEDVWNDIGIPKVEDFGDYVQLVVHGVREEDVDGQDIPLSLSELDVVIGRNFLVTHAGDEKVCAIEPMIAEVGRNCRLLKKGPAWVAHGILDRLVDEYLPMVDRFDSQIEAMEAKVLEGHALGEHAKIGRAHV